MRRSASSTTYSQRQTRRPRLAGAILLLLSLALLWPAVLSFDPTDWPSPKLWPHPQPVHNVCGRLGAWLAYQLFFWLGQGTYPLVLLATLLAILALARGVLADWPLRLTGLVLTSVAFGAASRMIQPGSAGSLPEGNGGIVGIALASVLGRQFAPVGSALLLACAGAVGLLLAADEIVVGVGRWAGRAVARAIRPARAAVVPAGARQPSIEQSAAVRINTGGSRLTAAGAGADGSGGPQPGVAEGAAERSEQPSSVGLAEEKAGAEGRRPASAVQAPVVSAAVAGGWPAGSGARAQPWPRILDDYELPPLGLLDEPEYPHVAKQESLVREKARLLERTLRDFRVEARVVQIDTGPVVTMYELEVAPGIKVSQIHSLADDMARVLKAPAVRVVAPMPGKNTIGVEVPSLDKEKVRLRELLVLAGKAAQRMVLPLFIGKDVGGNPLVADLAAMPHLLIAGTTGSGKSVCINALVMSLLMTQRPDHVKLILVDPKMVELSVFRDVPHLMGPIVTDMAQAEMILDWAATKMDERYELLAEAGVKNVSAYNRLEPAEIIERFNPASDEERDRIPLHLPHIIVVIDELADLMMTAAKQVEQYLSRLAQKSRAVGIHIVVATQRPQASIVTGLVKSNIPCRIAFRVASRVDSRIVLDQNGAEVLMGAGDMLFMPPGSAKLIRAQGTYVEEAELKRVIDYLKERAPQEFHQELVQMRANGSQAAGPRDELFDEAARIVLQTRRGSVSLLQRRLTIGYSRASRLIDQMAEAGIVGPFKGSQAREVLLSLEQWEQLNQQSGRQ